MNRVRYEDDLVARAEEQASLPRAGELAGLDREHLAEEIVFAHLADDDRTADFEDIAAQDHEVAGDRGNHLLEAIGPLARQGLATSTRCPAPTRAAADRPQ